MFPEPQEIITPYLTYLIRGTQWEVTYHNGVCIDLTMAKAIVDHRRSIQKGFITLLMHGERKVSITPEAKEYFASPEGTRDITAAAILFNSKTMSFVINLVLWFRRQTELRMATFTDPQAARAWLWKYDSLAVDRYGRLVESGAATSQDLDQRTYRNPAIARYALTDADLDVIRLLPLGLSCKEMAKLLGLSYRTVENRIYGIRKKLNVENMAALIQKLNDLDLLGKNAY